MHLKIILESINDINNSNSECLLNFIVNHLRGCNLMFLEENLEISICV